LQLLQQDAALLNSTIASQNDAITKIAQARSNAATIKASQGTTDPNAALAAARQMTAGIRVFVENYPDYGAGSNAHSVLVQIEGSFSRIEYARAQFIQEQTDFNKWLLTQIPMNLFYHPVQILGSNANPAEPVSVPHYVQPTPSPWPGVVVALLGGPPGKRVLDPGEFVMMHKRLIGIKQRAEEAHEDAETGVEEFKPNQVGQAV
jgi:hypothetical protein